MNNRNIEIDLEVHKFLELNRNRFSETECEILRRVFIHKENFGKISQGSSALHQANIASEVGGVDLHFQKVARLTK